MRFCDLQEIILYVIIYYIYDFDCGKMDRNIKILIEREKNAKLRRN